MNNESIFLTINHLYEFGGLSNLRVKDELFLKKDKENCYDDEAIAVYARDNFKIGYVANSVHSVVRGTYSAGRLYDYISDHERCIVRFVTDDMAIAELKESIIDE